jgi:HAD superfamily hydrolase (TIGR01509 family)
LSEPHPHRVECLLWDVDGTLTDSTSLITESLDYTYRKHYGRTLPDDALRALIGTPLRKQIRVFGEPEAFGAEPQAVMDDFIAHYESQKSRERILRSVVDLLVEGKRRGLPTALVTSKNREELDNTLPRLEIADFVDVAITADDVVHPKPDPEGLRIALERLGAAANRSLFIGDTVHDMRAARAAGVRSVGVTWGAASRIQLENEGAAYLCDTPVQLRTVLFGAAGDEAVL